MGDEDKGGRWHGTNIDDGKRINKFGGWNLDS